MAQLLTLASECDIRHTKRTATSNFTKYSPFNITRIDLILFLCDAFYIMWGDLFDRTFNSI